MTAAAVGGWPASGGPPRRVHAPWPAQPVIYEINTWVWLAELAGDVGHPVDLASVPGSAWDEAVPPGVDAVWLMGVWERSPRGVAVARQHEGVAADHRAALGDFSDDDVVGSPYCIRGYTVDPHLGGDAGLAVAREELRRRGARLIVDYVPNHVAQDHPWVTQSPELFVRGTQQEAHDRPDEFIALGGHVIALGRDPHFAPWQDVCQLNAFSQPLRDETARTLASIAQRADGVRCDMAMLLTNEIFARTWGERAGTPPPDEFWPPIVRQVREESPDFLFVAEVYWDMEAALLEQGFDHCYDKRLHDRLIDGDIAGLRAHLTADVAHQRRLVRFLENHDETRAAAALPAHLWRAAAVAVLTLPGALLLYEGQFCARTVRPPVALGRRPREPVDATLQAFYADLLGFLAGTRVRGGSWVLCDVLGWPDNDTAGALLAWSWTSQTHRHLVVVNLSPAPAQGRVVLPWELRGDAVVLHDPLQDATFARAGDELTESGLHVELEAGGWHVFAVATDPGS